MMFTGENNLKKVAASGSVSWSFQLVSGADKAKLSFSVVAGPDAENAPEWTDDLEPEVLGGLSGERDRCLGLAQVVRPDLSLCCIVEYHGPLRSILCIGPSYD